MSEQLAALRHYLVLVFLLGPVIGPAQTESVFFEAEDQSVFNRIIAELNPDDSTAIGEVIAATGTQMLNIPYEAGTLEIQNSEILIVNLRGLDCTTFVENALVIGGMLRKGQTDWNTYLKHLEHLRYRDGKRNGYPSRLHYFTDWIRNNTDKGLVQDITQQLGGVLVEKDINFMGTHPDLYPALESEVNLKRIREIEANLAEDNYYVLAKEGVTRAESQIQNGDIIALATAVDGLDVTHTGLAYRKADGRVHLLHASTRGAVEISELPLSEYLEGVKGNTGIIVVRPLLPKD